MTFDEARLMASVNARAHWAGPSLLTVRNDQGAAYLVETIAQTCECPSCQAHEGRYPCKHLLGWTGLLRRQRVCRRTLSLLLLDLWNDLDERGDGDGYPRARPSKMRRRLGGPRRARPPENERALAQGRRLLSSYAVAEGGRPWIITRADHAATTLLLVEVHIRKHRPGWPTHRFDASQRQQP